MAVLLNAYLRWTSLSMRHDHRRIWGSPVAQNYICYDWWVFLRIYWDRDFERFSVFSDWLKYLTNQSLVHRKIYKPNPKFFKVSLMIRRRQGRLVNLWEDKWWHLGIMFLLTCVFVCYREVHNQRWKHYYACVHCWTVSHRYKERWSWSLQCCCWGSPHFNTLFVIVGKYFLIIRNTLRTEVKCLLEILQWEMGK